MLCAQVYALEHEASQAATVGQTDRRSSEAAAVLESRLWQQDQICHMQQQLIERLQRIKACCLPH